LKRLGRPGEIQHVRLRDEQENDPGHNPVSLLPGSRQCDPSRLRCKLQLPDRTQPVSLAYPAGLMRR
jgi:hypothetical protein